MIYLVDDAKQVAGGQYSLLQLAKGFLAKKEEFRVIVHAMQVYDFYRGHLGPQLVVKLIFPLLLAARHDQVAVHLNTWRAFVIYNFLHLGRSSNFLFRVRSAPPRKWSYLVRLASLCWRGIYIANSEFIKGELRPYIPSAARVEVIYNYHGISDLRLTPVEPSTFTFTCAARISKRKNQLMLLDIAPQLLAHDDRINIKLYGDASKLSGQGQYLRTFEAKFATLKKTFGERIDWVPQAPQVEVYRTNAMLVPHRVEPLGRTLLEALYLGLPVVLLREGGNMEVFDEDSDAAFYTSDNPESWLSASIALFEMAKRRGGQNWAGDHADEKRIAKFSFAATCQREMQLIIDTIHDNV